MCAYLVYRIVLKRHIIVFTLFRYPVISSGQKCQQELHKLTLKLPGGGDKRQNDNKLLISPPCGKHSL